LSSSIHEPLAAPARRAGDDVITVRAPTDALLRARDVLGYRPLLRTLGSPDLKAGYKQSGA